MDYEDAKILGIDYAMCGMAVFSENIKKEDAGYFRKSEEQGAGLICMEMVSAKAISYHNKNTEALMEIDPLIRTVLTCVLPLLMINGSRTRTLINRTLPLIVGTPSRSLPFHEHSQD